MSELKKPEKDLPLRFDWRFDPEHPEKDDGKESFMTGAMKLIEIWRRKMDEHEE